MSLGQDYNHCPNFKSYAYGPPVIRNLKGGQKTDSPVMSQAQFSKHGVLNFIVH